MTARFILSLDCEGKWGVADHLDRSIHATLSDARLRVAYHQIVALLDEYAFPATFAFVGCFAERKSALYRLMPRLREFETVASGYIGPAIQDITEGSGEGWHGDWAIEAVTAARTPHEVALHGVTHIPWTNLSRQDADREMAILNELETPCRYARTFVYPRNKVAHVDALATAGISAYRLNPPRRSRFASLASEFDLWSAPEPDSKGGEYPVPIPAGLFVNWQSGLRKFVPNGICLMRARWLLDRAESTNKIVHYWLHPENVATAPATLNLLRGILELIAERRDKGRCDVLTQNDYAKRRLADVSRDAYAP